MTIGPVIALVLLWDDPGSTSFVLTAIGLGIVIVGVLIVSNVGRTGDPLRRSRFTAVEDARVLNCPLAIYGGWNGDAIAQFSDTAQLQPHGLAAHRADRGRVPSSSPSSRCSTRRWASDSAEYLAEVADDKGRYIASGAVGTIGSLVFIPGLLGVMRLFRRRSVSLGQIAAGLLTVGVIGLTATLAFNGFDIILADHGDAHRRCRSPTRGQERRRGRLLRLLLLHRHRAGLDPARDRPLRRRIVPIWSPVLLVVAISRLLRQRGVRDRQRDLVPHPHGRPGPPGHVIWGLSDDQWERWELPLEEAGAAGTTAPPPPPPTVQ